MNIREKHLKEVVKDFKNKDITIQFNDGIEGTLKIKKSSIIYDEENGYINIIGQENKLRINTTIIYRYTLQEDHKSLEIKIDSQMTLKIQKT